MVNLPKTCVYYIHKGGKTSRMRETTPGPLQLRKSDFFRAGWGALIVIWQPQIWSQFFVITWLSNAVDLESTLLSSPELCSDPKVKAWVSSSCHPDGFWSHPLPPCSLMSSRSTHQSQRSCPQMWICWCPSCLKFFDSSQNGGGTKSRPLSSPFFCGLIFPLLSLYLALHQICL